MIFFRFFHLHIISVNILFLSRLAIYHGLLSPLMKCIPEEMREVKQNYGFQDLID